MMFSARQRSAICRLQHRALPGLISSFVLGVGLVGAPASARELYGSNLGSVDFPVSCAAEAQLPMQRGLALLHHMTYRGAHAAFQRATEIDPSCALGYWGQAMTVVHPLWSDAPEQEAFNQAFALLKKAAASQSITPREKAYIDAHRRYFAAGRQGDESTNLQAWQSGWEQAHQEFPRDPEIQSFLALAVLANADPEDKTYATQKQSAAIALPVLGVIPDHPGAHHYLIHAYDNPALVRRGLTVARSYGEIAPSVPHALHMPSHLFIRAGLWDEAIAMNRRSADAALLHPAGEMVSLHYPHALDYLVYARLQRGEIPQAQLAVLEIEALDDSIQPHIASAYALAAIPARLTLERGDWRGAATVQPVGSAQFPWQRFPAMQAITHFARAVGAARSGELPEAQKQLDVLTQLRRDVEPISAYWGKQVLIQETAARAWMTYGTAAQHASATETALALLREAVALEASTEKHPVTPGEVLPAAEQYGDMLMDLGRHGEAYQAYRQVLKRSPGRHLSLFGAGLASERQGQTTRAARYYQELLSRSSPGGSTPGLIHAREFLGRS